MLRLTAALGYCAFPWTNRKKAGHLMYERTPVEPLSLVYRLLNPGSVVLVSVGDGEEDNLFPVTWNMPVRKDPPMAAVLVGKSHYSYKLIERTGELCINIMSADRLDALYGCGTVTGARVKDKWSVFGLRRQKAAKIDPPLVAEAVACLECRIVQVVDMGQSALLISQIVAAAADRHHFRQGGFRFENGLKLLHHLGGADFAVTSEVLTARSSS